MKIKKINNYLILIIGILSFLVMMTTHFVVDVYSKYSTSYTQSDSARVAKFDINVDLKDNITNNIISESINYDFKPGSEVSLNINFTGINNEVKVKYIISFETYNNLPLTITYLENDVLLNSIENTINPLESFSLKDIIISWPADKNNYLYSGEVDLVKVKIIIEQVD